eukprot:scaffold136923_cov148-Phaeocystis_antarctica.AAC.1
MHAPFRAAGVAPACPSPRATPRAAAHQLARRRSRGVERGCDPTPRTARQSSRRSCCPAR